MPWVSHHKELADQARVQAEYKTACHLLGLITSASRCPSDRLLNEHIGDMAAQIERQAQEIAAQRAVLQRVDYFGEGLIQREYEPGSAAVRELVAEARKSLSRLDAAPAEAQS